MKSTTTFFVVIVLFVGNEYANGNVPSEVKSARLRPRSWYNVRSMNLDFLEKDPDARRNLCTDVISMIRPQQLGAFRLPSSKNYYVSTAQMYEFEYYGKSPQPLSTYVAVQCPTFPSLYICSAIQNRNKYESNPRLLLTDYLIFLVNPYMDYEFEFELVQEVKEADPSKKDKKKEVDQEEEKKNKEEELKKLKEKKGKKKVGEEESANIQNEEQDDMTKEKEKKEKEDDEEGVEKLKEKEGKENMGEESEMIPNETKEDNGTNDKKKKKKEKDEEEDPSEQNKKDKKKDKKDKKKDKSSPYDHLSHLMTSFMDIEKRWHLCNNARKLIRYEVDFSTYSGDIEPKIYLFSYDVRPTEIDVGIQCFKKPIMYLRPSRSGSKNVVIITLGAPGSVNQEFRPGQLLYATDEGPFAAEAEILGEGRPVIAGQRPAIIN